MKNDWIPTHGYVPRHMTTNYSCVEDFFFEDDRDKEKIFITCQDDGTFDTYNHDQCVRSNFCSYSITPTTMQIVADECFTFNFPQISIVPPMPPQVPRTHTEL